MNLLWKSVKSYVTLMASIVVAGVGISGALSGSSDFSKGATQDMFDVTEYKLVSVNTGRTLGHYSKGFMHLLKRGSFVLQRATKPARV